MRRCMSKLSPVLKSKTMNLPRRRMADMLLSLIRLQNFFADGSAIVGDQKTFAPVMVVPSTPAVFKSLTMVCTSGSSGMVIQSTEDREQMSDDRIQKKNLVSNP